MYAIFSGVSSVNVNNDKSMALILGASVALVLTLKVVTLLQIVHPNNVVNADTRDEELRKKLRVAAPIRVSKSFEAPLDFSVDAPVMKQPKSSTKSENSRRNKIYLGKTR